MLNDTEEYRQYWLALGGFDSVLEMKRAFKQSLSKGGGNGNDRRLL